MGRLNAKSAIVTGAGGGIAAAIAERFAAEGATVLCTDIDAEAAERTAQRVVEAGGQALARACDVANEGEVSATVEFAEAEFPSLQIIVNAAATTTTVATVTEMDPVDWEREIAVNLTGVFRVCRHAIPRLKAAGGGSVINIASQLGRVVVPRRPAYVTSKAAVIQLTKSIAIDFAKDNIRANSLSPGAVETERLLANYGTMEEVRRHLTPLHPIGRLGQPADIADAAVFLASDESAFMTGADLVVDGGYTAV